MKEESNVKVENKESCLVNCWQISLWSYYGL